ncbi:putative olfactory receptor 2W6 [Tiliqua scincoides]|uniref:putative olfactory receptor 2W6 n=1 Tax=Tiliqua scincoides TaxID=71010 RepID=UPI003463634D
MVSNFVIIMLVQLDSRLHTPMYFFLSNLSGLEMCFVSSTIPQMLVHMLAGDGRLAFNRCVTQMYFTCSLGCTEGLLLGAMAYDRYVAICCPLVYVVVMSKGRCLMLAAISWACGFLLPVLFIHCLLNLPFCGHNYINHFFCNLHMLSGLVCGDIHQLEAVIFVGGVVFLLGPLCVILISYGLIIISVVRMSSGGGRSKAFSTCASHLTVVTMFYGSIMALYMRPRSGKDFSHDKYVSIFHAVITPLLNPLIYTLRNKDIHAAVAKVFHRGGAGRQD